MSTFILLVSFMSWDGVASMKAYDFNSLTECETTAITLIETGAISATCETLID